MESVTLVAGFLIPWMLGVLLLALVDGADGAASESRELAWTLGCGWFVGAFLLTLWMRALSLAGVPFGVVSIAVPLLLAFVVVAAWARRRVLAGCASTLRTGLAQLGGQGLRGWHRAAWLGLLAWLAIRYALLLAEVAWRPIYPWDAWTQWATKARVWFELQRMVPFAALTEWLAAGGSAYIDSAPHYPATVPLLQTWGATLLG